LSWVFCFVVDEEITVEDFLLHVTKEARSFLEERENTTNCKT